MKYPLELSLKCKNILTTYDNTCLKRHIPKEDISEILHHTSDLKSNVLFYDRVKCIAEQNTCICKNCGEFHGKPKTSYCSTTCYREVRLKNKIPKQEWEREYSAKRRKVKYEGKIEGYDYLVCAICGDKCGELTMHLKIHNICPYDYKKQYNLTSLKCQKTIDDVTGENNPAYQHGGLYSPWSKDFIKGYDEDKHNQFKRDQAIKINNNPHLYMSKVEYWIKKADGDIAEGERLYKQFQTKDLSFFLNTFGEEEGIKRYNRRRDNWVDSINSKPLEELLDINARKTIKSRKSTSIAELEIFNSIKLVLPETENQYALCRNPSDKYKKFYLYDIRYKNKIIEYNGDFWHANPEFFDESFVNPYNKLSQSDIHAKDNDKLLVAQNNGFTVLYIKEHEYLKNKQGTIEQCIAFLME